MLVRLSQPSTIRDGHLTIDGCRSLGTIGESGDVNLESWTCIEGMISTAIKTGHSTYYIAQDLSARGSPANLMHPYSRL